MAKKVYLGMIGDIMHPGYINIINKAAEYGDVIIGLFTDKAIANHRRLPYLTWEQRKNVVENIKNVAQVVPQDDWSYIPNLMKLKPDYIIHGDDWKSGPEKYLREEVFNVMSKIGGDRDSLHQEYYRFGHSAGDRCSGGYATDATFFLAPFDSCQACSENSGIA